MRNFSASEQLFICRAQCYQRLTKFKRALDNLKKAKKLEEVYKATVCRTKRLCKDDAEGDVRKEVNEHIEQTGGRSQRCSVFLRLPLVPFPGASPVALSEGQCCVLDEPFSGFPSPIQSNGGELLKCAFINTMAHSRNVVTSTARNISRNSEGISQTSNVKLSISYPSKIVNKSLHGSYQLIGKALVLGIPSRIANAAMNCQPVHKHIVEETLGILKKEVMELCSEKKILRYFESLARKV